jgi:hypothetical protein
MYDDWQEQIDRHLGRFGKNRELRKFWDYDAAMHGEDDSEGSVPMDCGPPVRIEYEGYPGDEDSVSDLYGKENWHEA